MKPQQLINNFKINSNKHGFSLIEILVAMFLVALVMGVAISIPTGGQELENQVKELERAIGFLSDESALRNTVTRLHIWMSKDPNEYTVEYGPSSQFVLPARTNDEINILSKEEEEKKIKESKDLNMKFARITEFQESSKPFEQNVRLIAVGNSQTNELQQSGEFSVYSFPSGEKDEVFMVLAKDESLATITTSAFSSKIQHNYYHLDKVDEKSLLLNQQQKAKELFDIWMKEKK